MQRNAAYYWHGQEAFKITWIFWTKSEDEINYQTLCRSRDSLAKLVHSILYIFDHINTSSSFNFRFALEDWIVVAVPKFEVVEVAVYGQVGYGVSNSVVTKLAWFYQLQYWTLWKLLYFVNWHSLGHKIQQFPWRPFTLMKKSLRSFQFIDIWIVLLTYNNW